MSVGRRFHVRRITIPPGQTVAVYPPISIDHVSIGNAAASDMKVQTEDPSTYEGDDDWLIVSPGYERMIAAPSEKTNLFRFISTTPAFWLSFSDPAATGVAVLIWT